MRTNKWKKLDEKRDPEKMCHFCDKEKEKLQKKRIYNSKHEEIEITVCSQCLRRKIVKDILHLYQIRYRIDIATCCSCDKKVTLEDVMDCDCCGLIYCSDCWDFEQETCKRCAK